MKFNPTSEPENSIVSHIDFLLFGRSDTFNDSYALADRTRNINIAWDEIIVKLYRADPNHLWDDYNNVNFPIATTTLIANQDHYDLLEAKLVVHRVRIKDNTGTYKTLTAVQRRELTDQELSETGVPNKYYKIGGAIFPVPVPDYGYDAGLEVQFQRGANHFDTDDTTRSPGFNPQFHHLLSVKAAKVYALANGLTEKVNMLHQMEVDLEAKLLEYYQLRSPDERPRLKLKRNNQSAYGLG